MREKDKLRAPCCGCCAYCALLVVLYALLLTCAAIFANAKDWRGRCVAVVDGDTVVMLRGGDEEVRVRLYGIDCPERGQAFGARAKQAASGLLFGKDADVREINRDRYGRTVAIIVADGFNVNEELLAAGMAWVHVRYCGKAFREKWLSVEADARERRAGLWVEDDPVPPWEHRGSGRPLRRTMKCTPKSLFWRTWGIPGFTSDVRRTTVSPEGPDRG